MAASTTRQRLIDNAYALFTRQGFHAVGLDRILHETGVSKQTFYNHFQSKDDLVLAVLDKRSEIDLATFRDMLCEFAGDDPRAQLDAIWDVLDAWFNRDDFRGCIFITAAAEFPFRHDPAHEKAAAHAARMQRLLADIAERAGADDPVALAEWLLRDQPGWTRDRIVAAMEGAAPVRVNLTQPIQVVLFYLTAVVLPHDGSVHFADDVYGSDAKLREALQRRGG